MGGVGGHDKGAEARSKSRPSVTSYLVWRQVVGGVVGVWPE